MPVTPNIGRSIWLPGFCIRSAARPPALITTGSNGNSAKKLRKKITSATGMPVPIVLAKAAEMEKLAAARTTSITPRRRARRMRAGSEDWESFSVMRLARAP